jgi:sugar phosphate permease
MPAEKPASTGKLHPNVFFLAVTSFLTDVSSEMLYNLLPLYLVNVLGTHRALVGLIDGVAETTASFVKVASGVWSDRLGKRKTLAVLGYGVSTIAKPFLYFASHWSLVLGVRFADRIGKGIRTAPRDALIAGSATPNQRGMAFGIHRAGDTAGAFTGILIAAGIIWANQSTTSQLTQDTFRLIVLASIIPSVLAVILLALLVKDMGPGSNAAPTPSTIRKPLEARFKRFLVVMVLFTLGNSSDSLSFYAARNAAYRFSR